MSININHLFENGNQFYSFNILQNHLHRWSWVRILPPKNSADRLRPSWCGNCRSGGSARFKNRGCWCELSVIPVNTYFLQFNWVSLFNISPSLLSSLITQSRYNRHDKYCTSSNKIVNAAPFPDWLHCGIYSHFNWLCYIIYDAHKVNYVGVAWFCCCFKIDGIWTRVYL